MILYLRAAKNNVLRDSVQMALRGYFSDIRICDKDKEKAENSAEIAIEDDKITVKYDQVNEVFQPPLKIGDILQKIQISRQNERALQTSAPIKIGKHTLLPDSNMLQMGKNKISLTDKEFDIIVTIFKATPNRVGRDELLHAIWGYGEGIETHTLETHIYRLRQKVEKDPSNPKFLKTDDEGYFLAI